MAGKGDAVALEARGFEEEAVGAGAEDGATPFGGAGVTDAGFSAFDAAGGGDTGSALISVGIVEDGGAAAVDVDAWVEGGLEGSVSRL